MPQIPNHQTTQFRPLSDRFEADASRMLRQKVIVMIREAGAEYITLEQGEMFVPGANLNQPDSERIYWQRDNMSFTEMADLFCRGLMAKLEQSGGGVIWRQNPRMTHEPDGRGLVAYAEGWFMSRRQVEGYEIARQTNASWIANRGADGWPPPWMWNEQHRLTPVEIWAA